MIKVKSQSVLKKKTSAPANKEVMVIADTKSGTYSRFAEPNMMKFQSSVSKTEEFEGKRVNNCHCCYCTDLKVTILLCSQTKRFL